MQSIYSHIIFLAFQNSQGQVCIFSITLLSKRLPMRKLALIFRCQIFVSGVLATFSFFIFRLKITLGIFALPIFGKSLILFVLAL